MKLSVLSNLYHGKNLEKVLSIMKDLGVSTVEVGAGGYPGKELCDPAGLLSDKTAFYKFRETFNTYGMDICALSVHGNPVHPDADTAKMYDSDFRNAVLLAEKLEIDTVVAFSGCPGDSLGSRYPNWVTCPWPDDYAKVLEWQWNEVLIPYWTEAADFARNHGVTRIAFEMHPGFCVYNPETLLRLRRAVGDTVGANLDPSHLFWQGIDPVTAAKELAGAVYHVHAKDSRLDSANIAKNGVLDTKPYGNAIDRSWSFRTVGYGHSEAFWKDLVSMLRLTGYDRVLSIEHEDGLMSADEGLKKAVDFLNPLIISD